MRGKFISIEGGDGSGKSTQIQKIEQYLKEKHIPILLSREPGGTEISESIREVLLNPAHKNMDIVTEILLYGASRRQHIKEFIEPNLKKGNWILTDRFFDSSLAYQGYGREELERTKQLNDIVTEGLEPDLTIYLSLPTNQALQRKKQEEHHELDRMELESQQFHERVYMGFERLYQDNPQRIYKIDATATIEAVFLEIQKVLDELIG